MKKHLLSLLVLAGLGASAQDAKNQAWISFGGNTPLGDFASTTSANGGYAKSGANFRLNYQHNFNEYIGLVVILHGTANSIDNTEQEKQLGSQFPGTIWKVESNGWGVGGFQVGPVGIWPVTERIHIEGRATLGFNSATSPETKATESTIPATITQASAKAPSFVYTFGVGAKFFFKNEHWFIPIHLDFLMCKAKFDNVETTTVSPSGTTVTKTNFTQKMNTYNSSIGIGYAF